MVGRIHVWHCLKRNFVFFYKNSVLSKRYTHVHVVQTPWPCQESNKNVKSRLLSFWGVIIFSIFSFPINGYFFYRCLRFLHFTANTQNRHAANYPAIFAQHHNYYYYCYFYAYKKNLEGESGQNKFFFFYDCRTHRERPVRGRTAAVVFEGRLFPPITRPNNTRCVVENEFR